MKVGELIIEAKLDNKTFTKNLAQQKKDLIQYEKEAEELTTAKAKYEADISEYEKTKEASSKVKEELKEVRKQYEAIDEKIKEIYDSPYESKIKEGLAENPGIMEERNRLLEEYNAKKKEYYDMGVEISGTTNQQIEEEKQLLTDVTNKLEQNIAKQQEIQQNIELIEAETQRSQIAESINRITKDISKQLTSITKKVVRWGLAIFGIRGAYMMVRNAISTITAEDEQLKADINYMKNAIAYALEPIVRKIVSLAEQLMRVVQTIYFMITGKNLFANANKNLAGANKQAKELKKQLAGFDEMNVLSDSSGGGESATATPSFDLTTMGETELPEWLKWLMAGLISAKIVGLISDLGLLGAGFTAFDKLLLGLGIAVFLYGVYETIKAIKEYIDNPSWENFAKILEGIAIALTGVAIALALISGPIALILMAIALVALLTATIIKNWDKIKTTFEKAKTWINDKFIGKIKEEFNKLPDWAQKLVKGIANTIIFMLNTLINGINQMMLPLRTAIVVVGKVMGKNWSLQSISIPRIPYLARGGIINMPGRGVPVGSAIAGERGAEGVIPLTDSQQMALLGEAIGKYITVNANITNTMNGRVISRELQKVQNETNFATNR